MNRQSTLIIVAVLVIVAVVAIVAVAAVGAFFILSPASTRVASDPDEVAVVVTVEQSDPPPTGAPPPTADDHPQAQTTSFEATTYHDEEAGFAFDYPASWTTGYSEGGSRGRTASLVALVAFSVWSGIEAGKVEAGGTSRWFGIAERALIGMWLQWVAVLAITLLRAPVERSQEDLASEVL